MAKKVKKISTTLSQDSNHTSNRRSTSFTRRGKHHDTFVNGNKGKQKANNSNTKKAKISYECGGVKVSMPPKHIRFDASKMEG